MGGKVMPWGGRGRGGDVLGDQEQMGRKCGALGEQEQERERRATFWTSKSIVGERATPWASGRDGDSLGECHEEESLHDPGQG
jgi:hypothetical protein